MHDEYSIEIHSSKIFDVRTKEYFSEVMSCYAAGNYRSAVVMLWSVAVCDLLFKLQNLVELYSDDKAKTILDEISTLQEENERSPIWETTLVESVAEKTQLLDIPERENLLHLQRQRHLAAHPVITANFQLHRPNRETTRALIRNTLDGLLTKAPILSKKITRELVEDIEQASEILIDDKKLKTYLESKYFNRFNPEVEKAVFKALWKFSFRLTDEKCNKNRVINYSTLRLLYSRNPEQFKAQVDAESDYFSTIANDGGPIVSLIHFLSKEPDLYGLLEDHAKTAIQHTADTNSSARCLAWFINGSLEDYAVELSEWIISDERPKIDRDTWVSLSEITDAPEWLKSVIRLGNKYYCLSRSYNTADQRFNDVIKPLLSDYQIDDCIDLIEAIESNDQVWARGHAYTDHRELRSKAIALDPQFNPAEYKIFNKFLDD